MDDYEYYYRWIKFVIYGFSPYLYLYSMLVFNSVSIIEFSRLIKYNRYKPKKAHE